MTGHPDWIEAMGGMSPGFALVLGLHVLGPGVTAAQDPRVTELAGAVWAAGADSALKRYGTLPASDRSPALLVAVADQLLWTGKERDAALLLDRAVSEAPLSADVRFQQGRAALQRAQIPKALAAFRAGLGLIDRDPSLADAARASLRRRLENRVALLSRAGELRERIGAYHVSDGRVLLFKFDPYLAAFPSLLDPATGVLRILYPSASSALEWRDDSGRAIGQLTLEGPPGAGNLLLQDGSSVSRVRSLGNRQETLRFDADGATIEGTLFRPARPGPIPAVVLTHGAGLSTRYNLVSEALAYAAAGVAAFVYDKPGLGASRGGNWLLLSIDEQVSYVRAAVARLRARPDIGEVGVWGFSQGGWVAPIAASRDSTIAFVVMVSGAAVTPQEQYDQAVAGRLRASGAAAEQVDQALRHQRRVWAAVNAGARLADLNDAYARASGEPWGAQVPRFSFQWELDWWRQNEIDPSNALRALKVPVLAVFGERDDVVPYRENAALLASHLAASDARDFTIVVLPGATHQLTVGDDYQAQYFETLVGWVVQRFAARDGSER